MTTPERLQALLKLAENASGQKWRVGNNQRIAGAVGYGPDQCYWCDYPEADKPTWVGRRNINGKMMLAHVHTKDEIEWEHGIYAEAEDGNLIVVNDTDEYGYMLPKDAALIAASREAVEEMARTLLAVLAAAAKVDARPTPGWSYSDGYEAAMSTITKIINDGGKK